MREGIRCNYSAQKPMGRPRKRPQPQATEPQGESLVAAPAPPETFPGTFPGTFPDSLPDTFPGAMDRSFIMPAQDSILDTMDLDMAFLDMDGANISFFDLLAPDNPSFDFNSGTENIPTGAKQFAGDGPSDIIWQMHSDQLLDGVNFDSTSVPAQPNSFESSGESTVEPSTESASEKTEHTPDLSPNSSSEQESPPEEGRPTVCGCLTNLYLALNSLQTLPKEVGEAMKVARTAAKTAHDTILCPVCSDPPIELVANPPIQSLQNMMVLGALLPSISNAYKHILKMVDDETAAASREGRKVHFTLAGYGGVWGQVAAHDAKFGATAAIANLTLAPHMWRSAVRALLKLDVYGLSPTAEHAAELAEASGLPPGAAGPGVPACSTITQPGLKDLIAMMEERTRLRHEQMDALVANGTLVVDGSCEYVPLSSGQRPTCMRIVDIAKQSMHELVIP